MRKSRKWRGKRCFSTRNESANGELHFKTEKKIEVLQAFFLETQVEQRGREVQSADRNILMIQKKADKMCGRQCGFGRECVLRAVTDLLLPNNRCAPMMDGLLGNC